MSALRHSTTQPSCLRVTFSAQSSALDCAVVAPAPGRRSLAVPGRRFEARRFCRAAKECCGDGESEADVRGMKLLRPIQLGRRTFYLDPSNAQLYRARRHLDFEKRLRCCPGPSAQRRFWHSSCDGVASGPRVCLQEARSCGCRVHPARGARGFRHRRAGARLVVSPRRGLDGGHANSGGLPVGHLASAVASGRTQ